MKIKISTKNSVQCLMDLLRIDGDSGRETQVAQFVREKLRAAGVPPRSMTEDQVHQHFEGFEQGNLIVTLPGTVPGERILFSAHMDRVPVCRGARPVRRNNRIESSIDTGVGADNRTGVAALIVLAETLLQQRLPHPPLTLLFTVGEEIGLRGASRVDLADLGRPIMGFNVDGGDPDRIVHGAIGADRLHITVHGRSAHAGMHPENGVSAGLIAAHALSALDREGWHGAVSKAKGSGRSNVGSIAGGEATNQVMDQVILTAETRSHSLPFLDRMTRAWERAFEKAARAVRNDTEECGRVEFQAVREYLPFRIPVSHPAVRAACNAVEALGRTPRKAVINGGLDANPLNERGLPTVTLGAGQHGAHTVDEYVDIEEFLTACSLLPEIAGLCTVRH